MKKITSLFIAFALGTSLSNATQVPLTIAQKVAENFYKQNSRQLVSSSTLAYTAASSNGDALFYVFNVNQRGGFVIVSAEDNTHPIIGYSTEGQFVIPSPKSTIGYWLDKRKKEINTIRTQNYLADNSITTEWNNYSNNIQRPSTRAIMSVVTPLVHTTWDQSPYYNDSCPNSAVTGCVATAMAQIMKFWNYPATGIGSSSYCDCSADGFTDENGTLSANYGATTYNWANMPTHILSHNSNIAQLMYQCGVSVNMDYDPDGSGAYVITADNPSVCAQISYVDYFNYDPNTIQGLNKLSYTDADWLALLKNDLDIGRPIQYVGDDVGAGGGHTWVCDGYDANDQFHMNWGWGGYDNGYYPLTNLNGGGYNFIDNQEALIGIQPIVSIPVDAGIPALISPSGTICSTFSPVIKLKNYGMNTLTSCVVNYKLDNGVVQTQNWSGSLASSQFINVTLPVVSTTSGVHSLTVYTTNPNGSTDGNPSNDQSVYNLSVSPGGGNLPLVQGFESSANLPTGWTLSNVDGDAAWQVVSSLAHTGTRCIAFNNCDGNGQNDMSGKVDQFRTSSYNFSGATPHTLKFDVSSAMLNFSGVIYSDSLSVYYSTDCGATWNNIYKKSGTALATTPMVNYNASCWSPTPTDWRTETIDLSALTGFSSVMFAFENRSGWANWLYIDNINISASATGIEELNSSDDLSIYPNPASTTFTIAGGSHNGKVHFALYDVSGREVKTGDINSAAGSFSETISISDLSHGMYFLKINDEKNVWAKKLDVK